MTVIIALKDTTEKKIYIGCDLQGTSADISMNWGLTKISNIQIPICNTDDEILHYETLYFGVSHSHYLQEYLTHAFTAPCMREDEDFISYLYNQFFQKLNNDLTLHKLLKNVDGALESDSGLILVFKDKIYNVYSDFSIVEEKNIFTCTGGGWLVATSVLTNLLTYHHNMSKKEMIKEALYTTGELNIYCDKNIIIEEIPFYE